LKPHAQRLWSVRRLLLPIALIPALLTAQDKPIDTQRSTITIHVGKAGLFSIAGHEHWVNAPISSGTLNDSDALRVEFKVDASKMQVKPDPGVNSKTQAEIQKDMQEMTLESARYPDITFRSSRIEKRSEDTWNVNGTLALHGIAKPVALVVTRNANAYTGRVVVKQTDFGIKPVAVGGGAVKVKDELQIEFRIVPGLP
jgi:polyisoprenoid-binding protein YceI